MNDKIRDVINHWDPINLFPLSPKDEYEFEILQIENLLSLYINDSILLGEAIDTIFLNDLEMMYM